MIALWDRLAENAFMNISQFKLSLPTTREIGLLITGIGLGLVTPYSFRSLDSAQWNLVGYFFILVGCFWPRAAKKSVDRESAKKDSQFSD